MSTYKKVKLKNGMGEYVYPVIDPNDAGGGSGYKSFFIEYFWDEETQQNITNFYELNQGSEEPEPEEIDFSDFAQAFFDGANVQMLIELSDYNCGVMTHWSPASEQNDNYKESLRLTNDYMFFNAVCFSGTLMNYTNYTSGYPVLVNFIYYNNQLDFIDIFLDYSRDINFTLRNNGSGTDAELMWCASSPFGDPAGNEWRELYQNRISDVQNPVEDGNYLYIGCSSPLGSIFGTEIFDNSLHFRTINIIDEDEGSFYKFTFSHGDWDDNYNYVAHFKGINADKELILTESYTDPELDPRGEENVYPYLSDVQIIDAGGGGGEDPSSGLEIWSLENVVPHTATKVGNRWFRNGGTWIDIEAIYNHLLDTEPDFLDTPIADGVQYCVGVELPSEYDKVSTDTITPDAVFFGINFNQMDMYPNIPSICELALINIEKLRDTHNAVFPWGLEEHNFVYGDGTDIHTIGDFLLSCLNDGLNYNVLMNVKSEASYEFGVDAMTSLVYCNTSMTTVGSSGGQLSGSRRWQGLCFEMLRTSTTNKFQYIDAATANSFFTPTNN